jgi:hypothetical protein
MIEFFKLIRYMEICLLCQCVFFATHHRKAIQNMTYNLYDIVIVLNLANIKYSKVS